MDAILNSIDNRDLALCFWLLVLLGWMLHKPGMRRSLRELIRALLQRKILFAFGIAALTTALLSYALSLMGLWTLAQLKGSFVWFIAACIPSVTDVPRLSENFSLFRKAALKNFELSVLVDFYINLFHAPFAIEVVLLPVALALTAMVVIAEKRADLKPAHGLLTNALAIIGLCWGVFQAFKLFTSFDQIRSLDTIRDFVLPIALNLGFLPFLVLFAVYAAYDSVFARVPLVVNPPTLSRYTKLALMARCGLNYMRLNRWFKRAWHLKLDSRSSIWRSIGGA